MHDMGNRRKTNRKILIQQVFSEEYDGNPVLLSELRWKVHQREVRRSSTPMTRAYRNSFARTIRSHLPGVHIHKLLKPTSIPLGVATRAALFRLRRHNPVEDFLSCPDACAMVHLDRVSDFATRGRTGYTVRCYFFRDTPVSKATFSRYYLESINLPVSLPISLVCRQDPSEEDISRLATVPCPIYPLYYGLRFEYSRQYNEHAPLDMQLRPMFPNASWSHVTDDLEL